MKVTSIILLVVTLAGIAVGSTVLIANAIPDKTPEQIKAEAEIKMAKSEQAHRQRMEQQEAYNKAQAEKPASVRQTEEITDSVESAVLLGVGAYMMTQFLK